MKNLLTIMTVLVAVALNSLAADKSARPNIIFILADEEKAVVADAQTARPRLQAVLNQLNPTTGRPAKRGGNGRTND
jgi:hypothetical protein